MKLGDTSPQHVGALIAAIRSFNCDPAPLLEQYDITDQFMANPDARISIPKLMHLGHSAIQLTGRHELGLEMGACSSLQNLGIPGLTAMAAPDLRTVMEVLARYEPLSSVNIRGQSSYHETDEGVLRFYSIAPYNNYNRFVVDSVLSIWTQFLQWLSGNSSLITCVDIEFDEPEYSACYEKYFDCPIRFSQPYNQIHIAASHLSEPLQYANPANFTFLSELCEQQLAQTQRGRSMKERVSEILANRLHGKPPSVNEVASLLSMPSWTLRRKLQEENITFQQILSETKRDLAALYLQDTELSLGELSYLLGFSSPEAFQRAFKRWTGLTPGEFRRHRLG